MFLLYVLAGLALAVCIVVSVTSVLSINEMAELDKNIGPLTIPKDAKAFEEAKKQTAAWALFHGFEEDVSQELVSKLAKATTQIVVWRHREKQRLLVLYVTKMGNHYDLISEFPGRRGLTTSSNPSGGMLPAPPSNFVQTFSSPPLNELMQRHEEAEAYIQKKYQIEKAAIDEDTVREIKRSTKEHIAYIKSLFLWQTRAPYWFFIRTKLQANRPVSAKY